tara:strand:- start:345 stop:500 length:156 start_codon:yes stop_codon:yes gene_type:complete
MVVSVITQFNWRLSDVETLFIDSQDIYGLGFWYNKALEMDKKYQGLRKKTT